ncbi:hypothetical protein HK405_002770, partial [Cladochytrium tenue]
MAFGGQVFHSPQRDLFENPTSAAKVLDVGCGPGYWTADFAKSFPACEVVGLDINDAFLKLRSMPKNVTMLKHNILEPLH